MLIGHRVNLKSGGNLSPIVTSCSKHNKFDTLQKSVKMVIFWPIFTHHSTEFSTHGVNQVLIFRRILRAIRTCKYLSDQISGTKVMARNVVKLSKTAKFGSENRHFWPDLVKKQQQKSTLRQLILMPFDYKHGELKLFGHFWPFLAFFVTKL